MALKARSTAWFVISTLVCAACSGDEAAGPGSSEQPNQPAPPAAGSGASAGKTPKPGAAGRSGTPDDPQKPGSQAGSGSEPLSGETDFTSADTPSTSGGANNRASGSGGFMTPNDAAAAPPTATSPGQAEGTAATREVERGDIYRVLSDKRILNLNAYRGLQVIDVSNVDAPRIEGRYAVAGTPLEMYVVGQRAIVLLNDWRGYYGARDDVKVEAAFGGVVLNVDLSNRAQPKLLSQAVVRGSISTSRLTQGGGQAALYVAATVSRDVAPYTQTTLVKSFDVSGDAVTEKSEIDLGGYVRDVQATSTDLLLVSSQDHSRNQPTSTVSVIDISRPDGTMVRGGTVTARGVVENKFNMDAYNGVLRVVSGATWSGTRENHLETFSLADLTQPRALSHCSFGANEMLYATIFIENKGFFVTYFRQDPFHAFSIDDQGRCEEHAAFIVSGWNDFLRPTLGGTRLVGIGTNDAGMRRAVSVSLYDTTNIDNPNPLLARRDLALDNGYSEAQWDDRAFSVIEAAVNVQAANGANETGLILVPYQGYDPNKQEYVAQVQLLTFSDRTLTPRGIMDHGSSVRRSFLADARTAANLSEEELRLFDIGDPNAPQSRGKVEVAPNYRQVFVYGDYVARVHDTSFYFGWNGNPDLTPPPSYVEIVPRSGDVDTTDPVAQIAVPSRGNLLQVGSLLVSVLSEFEQTSDASATPPDKKPAEPKYKTKIQVYDLSDPTKPAQRGSLETDRIRPNYYGGGYYPPIAVTDIASPIGCFGGCYPRGGGGPSSFVVGDAVVFPALTQQQKSVGQVTRCYEYPSEARCATARPTPGAATPSCALVAGGRTCVTPEGGEETCSGSFYECTADGAECKPIEDKIPVSRSCSENEEFRYWQAYAFDPLDLRNPDAPVLATRVEMDESEEGTSILRDGSALYFNFQKPQLLSNDPRAHVKRYVRRVDFADPQRANVGPSINVPGDVIAADGSTLYTRDLVWDDADARTLVARLIVRDELAYLQASRVFNERAVSAVELDGAGHVLVSSDPASAAFGQLAPSADTAKHKLSILSADTLEVSGETEVDSWATFVDAVGGRALFSVSGGLLVFSVEDPAKPVAQAYFPTLAFPSEIYFDGNEAMFAGGPYGVYRFDTNVFNLLMK